MRNNSCRVFPSAVFLMVAAVASASVVAAPEAGQPERGVSAAAFSDCAGCPSMVRIPAGENLMGTSQEEGIAEGYAQWPEHESPVHTVKIAGFALAQHEVTRAQYATFVAETRHPDPGKCVHMDAKGDPIVVVGGSFRNTFIPQASELEPVVCVSWDDAVAYAAWLAKKTGKPYRLPTEAEWEYAARAGTHTPRYFGDTRARDQACRYASVADFQLAKGFNGGVSDAPDNVFQCDDGYVHLAPVGTFPANGFGLYDMLGNVSEWVLDCYHIGYKGAPTDGSEWRGECAVEQGEIRRIIRGGAFGTDPRKVRAGWRSPGSPMGAFHTGFRVALSEVAVSVAGDGE